MSVTLPIAVVQRVRIRFGVEWPLCYASVLDLGRVWERMLRRAGAPLAYTQGYNPHPRLAFATALPVGYTSAAEVVDVLLADRVDPDDLVEALRRQAPVGLTIGSAEAVPLDAPSLQAVMREARYRVTLRGADRTEVERALEGFLARRQVLRERERKGKVREYDLRALIRHAWVLAETDDAVEIEVLAACGPEGSGRPEELVEELGVAATGHEVRRLALIWEGAPAGGANDAEEGR